MDVMSLRRALMMQKPRGLPAAYQRVEYIENTGTQYINTNYVPTISPKIVTRILITNATDTDRFGNINNDFPSFIVDVAKYDMYNRWGNTSFNRITLSTGYDGRILDCVFGQNTNINNEVTSTFTDIDWSGNNTSSINKAICIFRARTISKGMRIYSCKLYDGTILVGEYIPCYRKSDNEIGMYDTASKTFYTNAGTGEFIIPT